MGLQDGRPYEVFTGKIEEDAMYIPRKIDKGYIIKVREEDGTKRYDFQYTDRYGYTNTIGGISRLFDEEFWNYAKLISGVLRHGMPIEKTVSLIESLHLNSESINTWKTGVCRALKQYIVDGTKSKGKCPSCGQENMAYQNGCLTCMSCGYSKRLETYVSSLFCAGSALFLCYDLSINGFGKRETLLLGLNIIDHEKTYSIVGSRGTGYVCVGAGHAQKTELRRFRVERFLG